MQNTVLVAGGTGNLGERIIDALLKCGRTNVRAIVRRETDSKKISALKYKGVEVFEVNMQDKETIVNACTNVDCVISALSGLSDVIIDTQASILDAAVAAGVPRFIPSDFSIDFLNLEPGKNRNLDLRRSFHEYLKNSPIKATTIFNGAFMELISGDMPLILYKFKRILCWGDPSVKMDFTTMDDVAAYTAQVVLDVDSPRYLRIAGDSVSVTDVKNIMTEVTGIKHKVFKPGNIKRLNSLIGITRFFSGDSKELYPAWQGMQYMRDMMEGKAVVSAHDNDRYGVVNWITVREEVMSYK